MDIQLLRVTQNPFVLISGAYRLCYASMPKDNFDDEAKFIEACIRNRHTSPLEHCSATFLVTGISRTCSHQLVRHRIASYTQESQRYVDSKGSSYTIPGSVNQHKELCEQFQRALTLCELTYNDLVAAGVKKEDARFILPQAIQTKIMVTMNFRALRNFLDLRLDKHAQWEIRSLAFEMLNQLLKFAPEIECVFKDLIIKHSPAEK